MTSRSEQEEIETRTVADAPSSSGSGSSLGTEDRITRSMKALEEKVRQRLFAPAAPTRIGRFIVLEEIGRGAMGTVYSAYDEHLDRKVAVKVLLEDDLPTADQRLRFLREAQALARLSHPNVVTVHEVGETEDTLFLAMEFVRGQDLREWFDSDPTWSQVLDAFLQAGRGLVAAHEAGLVHRDLKPHNIVRSDEGAVKVLDFGLARSADDGLDELDESLEAADLSLSGSSTALASALTRTGAIMGTPAYMSPEQLRGDAIDARSDQYSFCVALWQGLYGQRPFTVDMRNLGAAQDRTPPEPPRSTRVPRFVSDALRRGLATDPSSRFASMAQLLEALSRQPARVRRRMRSSMVAVLAVGAAGAWLAGGYGEEAPCTGARAELDGVWDDERRGEVRAALLATELGYAEDTWGRVAERLDDYADSWVAMHTEACEATAVARTQSAGMLDLRMQCLRRRKLQTEAVVDVLASVEPKEVPRAIQLVSRLPLLARCADAEALLAAVPPPDDPEVAAEVESIEDELSRARGLVIAGRYEQGRAQIDALYERAEPLGYQPLQAKVLDRRGHVAYRMGDYDQAVDDATEAYRLALRSGDLLTAAETATVLVHVLGADKVDIEAARIWSISALALAQQADPGGRQEGTAFNVLGMAEYRAGQFAEAAESFDRALGILTEVHGEDHESVALVLSNVGAMLDEQGRFVEGEAMFRRALEIDFEIFGEDHPFTAGTMGNVALALQLQGRFEEAKELHQRVLGIRQRTLGPEHPSTGLTYNNLGWDYMGLELLDEATEAFTEGLSVFEGAFGPDHPRVAMAVESLASAELERGRLEQAEQLHRRALRVRKETLGADHPNVALSLAALAEVEARRSRWSEAVPLLEDALEILQAMSGGQEKYEAETLGKLGHALLGAERAAEALPLLERALELRAEGTDPSMMARLRLDHARALVDGGGDAERARAEADAASADLAGVEGRKASELRDEIRAWLRAHPAG